MAASRAVHPLRPSDADAAAGVLLRAFFDDPWVTWLFPDSAKRRRRGVWFMRKAVEYGLRYGAVFSDDDTAGAAIWLTPGNTTMKASGVIRIGLFLMPFRVGTTAFTRFMATDFALESAHKAHAPGPHWYLFMLGVDPSRQRSGIGSALVQAGIDRAEEAGLPCYVDTQAEANVAYYERHGFRVVAEVRLPRGGPLTWTMLREPRR